MPHYKGWFLLAALMFLIGCANSTKPQVISAQRQSEKPEWAKHKNELGRRNPLGNLLVQCVAEQPANPELKWYVNLPPKKQREVVDELNHHVFFLSDDLEPKSRIDDDYNLRWTFVQIKPTIIEIRQREKLMEKSQSFQISAFDCVVVHTAKEMNDEKNFKTKITWQPEKDFFGNSTGSPHAAAFTFTLNLKYSAHPEIVDQGVKRVDSLHGIESLTLLDNQSVVLTIMPSKRPIHWQLSLNGKDGADTVTAVAGDNITIYSPDVLGAGYSGFVYRGVKNGYPRFEDHSWFYDIVPEIRRLVEVLPYKKGSTTQP